MLNDSGGITPEAKELVRERDSSSDEPYRLKKKLAKSDKNPKRSARKSKIQCGMKNADSDNAVSGCEGESRSRPKAKQEEACGTRKITDYLSYSTTQSSRFKTSVPVDERLARLEEFERQHADKDKQLSNIGKQVSTLDSKVRQAESANLTVKENIQKTMIRVLMNLYEEKRIQKLKVREDLGLLSKSVKGHASMADGYLLTGLRGRIEALSIQIKELEELPVRRRSRTTKAEMEKEREDSEIRISVLSRQRDQLEEELKKKIIDRNDYIHQYKLALFEQESQLCKQKWPIIGNRYQPLELLGKGGFSQVYRGYDLEENVEVAIKLSFVQPHNTVDAAANYMKHIQRQCKTQRNLTHPNINRLIEVFQLKDNALACIVELCEGTDLAVYLKRNECLEEKEARHIIKQIISALHYLSELPSQVIHYDLKPQNIMVNESSIKIIDFGLCKLNDTGESKIELTSPGTGTYWYLPPETFDDENEVRISNKVDIWSTGVIFYELLYGKRPFGHNMSQETILSRRIILNARQVNFDVAVPKDYPVSEGAKDFIRECLQYDQERRISVIDAYNHPYLKRAI